MTLFEAINPVVAGGGKYLRQTRVTNAVLYFAHNASMLWKTKLNKLLFYTDFLYFNKYTVSLTGAKYIELDYGPVPDKYEALLWFLETNKAIEIDYCQMDDYSGSLILPIQEFNHDVFSEEELKVITQINREPKKDIANGKSLQASNAPRQLSMRSRNAAGRSA